MNATPLEIADRLRVFGYARLDARLDTDLLERLRSAIAPSIRSAVPDTQGFRDRRLLLTGPELEPFFIPEILDRPEVLAPLRALLGPEVSCKAVGVDVNLPGSSHQMSHMDCRYLFPEHAITLPPFAVVLNLALVDVTEDNGPLELWPATHGNQLDVDQDRLIASAPAVTMTMPAGSLFLRDIRTWHRGTPNRSHAPRPQLGITYARPWYGGAPIQTRDRRRSTPPLRELAARQA
jgi:ectoine hydroxylase-related dioxygenase (phytanoyl-CoA dioxygenase family)